MRVQDIAKQLKKAGFRKICWDSKKGCNVGDFKIKSFDFNGIHSTIDVNNGVFNKEYKGAPIEKIINVLTSVGLRSENRNGIIAVFK